MLVLTMSEQNKCDAKQAINSFLCKRIDKLKILAPVAKEKKNAK